MSREKVIATFDAWALNGRDKGMEDGHGDVVRQVIARMSVRPGERVLDLGCGNGWATRLLAQTNAGVQAIGVDIAPQMIARAESLHSLTIRARYELGDFEALDFRDAHFDRLFSMEALYYARDVDKALAEAFRVLKPGAVADVIIDHYAESPATADWGERMGLQLHFQRESDWREAFARAGFAGVKTERVRDRRGPLKDEFGCTADEHAGEVHEAGSLWIHARKVP
jgi:ubiquinone/menaquinone biosynthesis C-methylase UbiE